MGPAGAGATGPTGSPNTDAVTLLFEYDDTTDTLTTRPSIANVTVTRIAPNTYQVSVPPGTFLPERTVRGIVQVIGLSGAVNPTVVVTPTPLQTALDGSFSTAVAVASDLALLTLFTLDAPIVTPPPGP